MINIPFFVYWKDFVNLRNIENGSNCVQEVIDVN